MPDLECRGSNFAGTKGPTSILFWGRRPPVRNLGGLRARALPLPCRTLWHRPDWHVCEDDPGPILVLATMRRCEQALFRCFATRATASALYDGAHLRRVLWPRGHWLKPLM